LFYFGSADAQLGLSLKSLGTINLDVILNAFLLARFFRILKGENYKRDELPALATKILKEHVVPANGWRYRKGALEYHVFNSNDWLQEDSTKPVLERRWWPANSWPSMITGRLCARSRRPPLGH
jgi:hypothetical protein